MSLATESAPVHAEQNEPRADAPAPQRRSAPRLRIPRKEVVDITTQLSIMIRTGVDVSSALKSCARRARRPASRVMLEDVHETVMSGNPLSEALRAYVHVFGETYVASVTAGEASGRLPEVLGDLAKMERSSMRLRGSIRTMLAYPIVLTVVSSLVLSSLVFFVLPQFAEIFEQFEMPLPVLTQILIAVSSELRTRFWLWIPLAILFIVGLIAFRRTERGNKLWDWFLLYGFLIRDVARQLQIGRACRLLGIMLESGVPLLECLRLAKTAASSVYYKQMFAALEDDVLNGRGLAQGLRGADFIPSGAADMLLTAEETGSIGVVSEIIGAHYEEEGEAKMKEIVTVLEPAITVIMGAVIAVIVTAIMLPLFDMAQVSSGKH